MIEDCTALVFAGGQSRRMGCDKLSLQIGGQSLLQRAIDLARGLFPSVLVSVQHPRQDIDSPQVCDEIPDAGPLAGLCAGLQQASTPWVFALAADMPWLLPEVIERLASKRTATYHAVVPVVDGQPYPLTAFYAVTALPALRRVLARPNQPGLYAAFPELNVLRVDERADRQSFNDLDTPEDAEAAIRYFGNPSFHLA